MNLHALRIFTKVAELESVSKAAHTLMISQPAVTIQIRNLEKELGLTLIKSKGRGITLTSNGEFLFKQAKRLFNLELDIKNKLAKLKFSGIEELNIAATHVPANFLLPNRLAKYKQAYPSININLKTINSTLAIEQLLDYKVDIAFVVKENEHHPDINYTFLMDLEYWFIVPYGNKLAEKEVSLMKLMNEPFILREDGSSTNELLIALCKIHKTPLPKVGLKLNGINESIRAIAAGYGAMLAPSIAVLDYIHQKQVERVLVKDIEIRRPIYLCTRKNEQDTPLHLTTFLTFMKNE